MKTQWVLALIALIGMSIIGEGEAAVVVLGGPGIAFTTRQPLPAVIVGPNGAMVQQTVYYDPAIGGVDLDTSWAGPNASVYFPSLQTGYVWYNGFWVDQTGYYWNGRERILIGHPHWRDHWTGYWNVHWHEGYHGDRHGGPRVSVHVHETIRCGHRHCHH